MKETTKEKKQQVRTFQPSSTSNFVALTMMGEVANIGPFVASTMIPFKRITTPRVMLAPYMISHPFVDERLDSGSPLEK